MTTPHIAIAASPLFHIGPLTVTNTLLTTWIVLALFVILAIVTRVTLRRGVPAGLQNVLESVMELWLSIIDGVTNDHTLTRRFFNVIVTIFLFVLITNWVGLIPGVGSIGITHEPAVAAESTEANAHHEGLTHIFRPATSDLSFTLTLALIAVFATQMQGIRACGTWGYFRRFLNFHSPILFLVGLLELVLEVAKVASFGFRLFGNIFAGEVLLAVLIALVPFVAPIPFYGMEIFVGAVQALVFSMLTLVFFKMATVEAH